MERLKKISCALLLVAMLCVAFSGVVFAAETGETTGTPAEVSVTKQQEELAKKEKALASKEKNLKAREKKLSREERKRKQAELKRQQEELKRQQEELKQRAENAEREKEELERQYAEKDDKLLLYGGMVLGVIILVIIAIVIVSAKRRKRSEELEKELIRSETLIESFEAQKEEAEKNAQKTQAMQKQNTGKNTISFVVMKDGMATGQLSAKFDTALVIGRAPDCGLRLDNEPTVSGHHCEVRTDGIAYYIRDLGSTNGTALNGVNITNSTKINNGDKLLLGTLELIVSGLPQSAPSMTTNLGGATIRQKV